MSIRKKLASLGKDWADADPDANPFERVPAGTYTVSVYDAELTESQNDNPMLKLTLAVLDPEYEGRYIWDNIVFTDKTVQMAKSKLWRLGLEIDDLEELEDRYEELRGVETTIKLTYKPNKNDPDGDEWARVSYKQAGEDENPSRGTRTKKAKTRGASTGRDSSTSTSRRGSKKAPAKKAKTRSRRRSAF